MAHDKIDNKPKEVYRPERPDKTSRLVVPRYTDKSDFEKVMEETDQKNSSSSGFSSSGQSSNTETKEAVRQVASQQERYGRDKDDNQKRNSDRERDRDDAAKPGESKESSGPRAKEAEKRVIGRGSLSERGHEGGEGGGHGTGSGSGRGRGTGTPLPLAMQGQGRAAGGHAARGKFDIELHAAQSVAQSLPASAPKPPPKPNMLTKAILDQIVQYARIVTKTDGDKELDMQLHEQVFKGLKLRVSVVKGKVDATFITESEEVLNLFNAQKSVLTQALEEKGIAVNSVNVIMV